MVAIIDSKEITKNVFKVLDILLPSIKSSYESSVHYPTNSNDMHRHNFSYLSEEKGYLTKQQIKSKTGLSKPTLRYILKTHKSLFIETPRSTGSFKSDTFIGLSPKGYEEYNKYYDENILEKNLVSIVSDFKKKMDHYIENSKKNYYTIKPKELIDFWNLTHLSFTGIREMPFEIKIKVKPQYKNKKDIYKLYIHESLEK